MQLNATITSRHNNRFECDLVKRYALYSSPQEKRYRYINSFHCPDLSSLGSHSYKKGPISHEISPVEILPENYSAKILAI